VKSQGAAVNFLVYEGVLSISPQGGHFLKESSKEKKLQRIKNKKVIKKPSPLKMGGKSKT
jgi:hypothetical protein